jgi:hypothetical protein
MSGPNVAVDIPVEMWNGVPGGVGDIQECGEQRTTLCWICKDLEFDPVVRRLPN